MTHTPEQIEKLKRDSSDVNAPIEEMLRDEGWNDCIDHLAAKGVNFGAVPEPIEGLEEAIENAEISKISNGARAYYLPEWIDALVVAARRYAAMTKGAGE